jgi:L-ascorbate metabolism protein UlaG (beta-lactamase superfamily)
MQITWVGHSTVLVRDRGIRVLTDPLLRNRVAHLRRVEAIDLDAVEGVDVVVISHAHRDHLDTPSLRLLRPRPPIVVPRGVGPLVARLGFTHVTELEAGESVTIGRVDVQATHAEHDGRRNPLGRSTPALGYVVSGSARAYFAGDTDLFEAMRGLVPGLDAALLPIAGWGPRLPPGHLDPERAARALSLLRPRLAIPIHWGTYRRLGLSTDAAVVREPLEEFVQFASRLAPDVAVAAVLPGETVSVSAQVATS